MTESGVITKTAMVFGQMNEPPGARLRVALSALTIAEYFRDTEGQDVLLFVDNIFRFVQAGSEVSALLGRIPSAVGYQPTLGTEMGALQERITSTKKGSVTSVQAIYVPADDPTDPGARRRPSPTSTPTSIWSARSRRRRIYPAVDPLDSTSRILAAAHRRPGALRGRPPGAADPAALQRASGHHRDPRHRRAFRRRQTGRRPRPQDREVPVAAVPRRRAVHRTARQIRAAQGDHPLVQGGRSPASTTICRSRRSTWSAPSTRSSKRQRRSRDA